MPYELVLLKNIHDPRVKEIDRYIELGGYKTAKLRPKTLSRPRKQLDYAAGAARDFRPV